MNHLAAAVSSALGVEVTAMVRLGGGDVAQSYRVSLADGRTVFAKTHHDPPPVFFVTEANGLRWLHECGAVSVPAVLAVGDIAEPSGDAVADPITDHGAPGTVTTNGPAMLVLEWIEESSRVAPDEAAFGRSLAALHRSGAPAFGRVDRRPTGSRSLPNEPCNTWAEFFAERRLLPLVRMARDTGAVDADVLTMVERIAAALDTIRAADEPAARLHGDLWAGNRVVDVTGRSWVIDPAAHGGHREFDLAMMRLFGGFGPDAFTAYHEVYPLADGWADRVPLHQLAPLLVHAVKFGGGYRDATRRAAHAASALVA